MLNLHLKRVVISIAVTLAVNCIFILEAILAYRRAEPSKVERLLDAISRPIAVFTERFQPQHGITQIIFFFGTSLIFYAFVTWAVLEVWAWVRGNEPNVNRSTPGNGR
jgi:hypothetical protein